MTENIKTPETATDATIEPIEPTTDKSGEPRAAKPLPRDVRDVYAAVKSVMPDEKRRAYFLLGGAGATIALLLLSRLIWLFEPLFDLINGGNFSAILYNIILAVLFTVYTVVLNHYIKKHTGERIFLPKKTHMEAVNALGVIAVVAFTFFVVSAGFKFKVKFQIEMASGITLNSLTIYLYYGLHIWLGLTAAELVRRGMNIIIPTRNPLPWGEIALVTVFGLLELIFETATTTHMFPWLYYIFTYVYACVYALTDHSYHLTLWACIILMVL